MINTCGKLMRMADQKVLICDVRLPYSPLFSVINSARYNIKDANEIARGPKMLHLSEK